MEEPKNFCKAPGSYHWALAIFIYLSNYLFIDPLVFINFFEQM